MRTFTASVALAGVCCAGPSNAGDEADHLGEASGVAVADGVFYVVDDEAGVRVVERGKPRRMLAASIDYAELKDLEGISLVGDDIIVIAEKSGVVSRIPRAGGAPQRLGALVHPPTPKPKSNKGWEGIAVVDARFTADGKPRLVAVHEGAPKAVAVFGWPSLVPEVTLMLPTDLDAALDDLSDVTVDPKSGELLITSDESRRLARVKLDLGVTPSLRLVSSRELPVGRDEKVEGVVVDDAGVISIVTDGSQRLFALPTTP